MGILTVGAMIGIFVTTLYPSSVSAQQGPFRDRPPMMDAVTGVAMVMDNTHLYVATPKMIYKVNKTDLAIEKTLELPKPTTTNGPKPPTTTNLPKPPRKNKDWDEKDE